MKSENDQKEQELRQRLFRLNFNEGDVDEEELKAEQLRSNFELRLNLLPKTRKVTTIRIWIAAASFALVLSVTLLFQALQKGKTDLPNTAAYSQSTTAKGERKTIILTDGSRVTMNSASVLKYPLAFKGEIREVELQGQAFFEIKHNPAHPFVIHTSKIDIQVLGTTFDVSNYKDDQEAAVTVSSGKVSVKTAVNAAHTILLRGDRLVYNAKRGESITQKVQPDEYILWQKGHYEFDDEKLSDICKHLERAYNVAFHFRDQELKNKRMGFRIRGENITRVMGMLALAGGFDYSIQNREITLKSK